MRTPCPRLLLLGLAAGICAALAAVEARAALYTTAAGYQRAAGSADYWGDEAWTYGTMRLEGGWYPFGRLSASQDTFYRWVLSPNAGLEKGFLGLGKARVSYAYSRGDFRSNGRSGDSHALEAGWFRAFSPRITGDLSYQLITGDLYGGDNHEFNVASGSAQILPRYAIVHQAQLALGVETPWRGLRSSGAFAAAWTSDGRHLYTETLGLTLPVRGPLAVQAAGVFVQSPHADGRWYASGGLLCAFSGRLGPAQRLPGAKP